LLSLESCKRNRDMLDIKITRTEKTAAPANIPTDCSFPGAYLRRRWLTALPGGLGHVDLLFKPIKRTVMPSQLVSRRAFRAGVGMLERAAHYPGTRVISCAYSNDRVLQAYDVAYAKVWSLLSHAFEQGCNPCQQDQNFYAAGSCCLNFTATHNVNSSLSRYLQATLAGCDSSLSHCTGHLALARTCKPYNCVHQGNPDGL
jgi:hypothetical protein